MTEWVYDHNEVVLHKRDRRIWHVTERLEDIDNGDHWYRLEDDSHTCDDWWMEADADTCFMSLGVTVVGKPVQAEELRHWFNHDSNTFAEIGSNSEDE